MSQFDNWTVRPLLFAQDMQKLPPLPPGVVPAIFIWFTAAFNWQHVTFTFLLQAHHIHLFFKSTLNIYEKEWKVLKSFKRVWFQIER